MTKQILRTGTTPLWGMVAGTADAGKSVCLLLNSANISTNISDAEITDSEGRKAGYIVYDCWQDLQISGQIIYDAEEDTFEKVCELFTVGAQVTDEDALALLDKVRVTEMNGAQTSDNIVYVCKSFNVNQSSTDAVTFDASFTAYGIGEEEPPTPSNFQNGPALDD